MVKVIDICGFVPYQSTIENYINTILSFEGYLDLFGHSIASIAGMELERIKNCYRESDLKEIVLNTLSHYKTAENTIRDLVNDGIEMSMVTVSNLEGLLEVSKGKEHVLPFLEVRINQIGIEETIKEAHVSGIIKGIVIAPFKDILPADSKPYHSIYSICEKIGLPIWIHSSNNWYQKAPNIIGHPSHIENVAISYPDLVIIAGHGGWPWINDLVAISWKRNNVYIDISGHRPKYFNKPGSGWEFLLNYGNSVISNKVLFGSTWHLMGLTPEKLINEVQQLPLKEITIEKWLYENAFRILH
ncbi:amidohydrolase family protein [Bacillus sp. JJ1533]|uniref:amidohydrolase family protein n=1 Tax=Bacillus sp. JJ1533 TaxID=3122959 RepID=UPI002FFFF0A6